MCVSLYNGSGFWFFFLIEELDRPGVCVTYQGTVAYSHRNESCSVLLDQTQNLHPSIDIDEVHRKTAPTISPLLGRNSLFLELFQQLFVETKRVGILLCLTRFRGHSTDQDKREES